MREKKTNPRISVVICTYNRPYLLKKCLESLAKQTISQSDFEIIVVDNGSKYDAATVAQSFSDKIARFQVIKEEAIGLSLARNRGWREAKGIYIAFIDDDAMAEPNWLSEAHRVISEKSPDILGGPIFPFYLTDKPTWFKDRYEIRLTSETTRELSKSGNISGSNFIVKRSILETLGGFDQSLGMKGDSLSYGEDTDLVIRARKEVPSCLVYYDPKVRVRHLVPAHKMSVAFSVRSSFIWGTKADDFMELTKRSLPRTLATAGLVLARIGLLSSLGLVLRNRDVHPYWQNYIVEEVAPLVGKLGFFFARLNKFLKH